MDKLARTTNENPDSLDWLVFKTVKKAQEGVVYDNLNKET